MRRIQFKVSGILRAENEDAALQHLLQTFGIEGGSTDALPALKAFGFSVETTDLGPVETQKIKPESVVHEQGTIT